MKKILELIKEAGAVREFTGQEIPDGYIDQIVEAGRWGLSVLGVQPWIFVPVTGKETIKKLSETVLEKSSDVIDGANIVLRVTSRVIGGAKAVIAVYNNRALERRVEKFGPRYVERARIAEIQTIGGAIQNMILQTAELGLGCIWLDAITFCSPDMNAILNQKNELIAFLAVGYAAVKPHRSKRAENTIVREFC